MKVFGFTGMPWSGKSEAVTIAKNKHIPVFRMGDFVWDEVKKRGLDLNAENVGSVAHDMREKHGNFIWAQKTVDAIKRKVDEKIVVIDGLRSIEELHYFREHLSDSFNLVAITAPDELRHKRAKNRKRADDSINHQDIIKRDKREKQWGIDQVISSADISICNDSSLDALRKKILDLFPNE
jgi:dephospho-CoA kinase